MNGATCYAKTARERRRLPHEIEHPFVPILLRLMLAGSVWRIWGLQYDNRNCQHCYRRADTQYLTGIKSETIRGHLISCHRDPEHWAWVKGGLVQLRVETMEIEVLSDQIDALNVTMHYSVPLRSLRYKLPSDLGDRIKAIIGEPVLITKSRQGYRLCTRADFDKLIQILRRTPLERIISLSHFPDDEVRVLRELRTPLRVGQLMATIYSSEHEYDPVTRKVIPPPLTLQTLACVLSMEYDRLLSITIRLALQFRKVRL